MMRHQAKQPVLPLALFALTATVGLGYFVYASSAGLLGFVAAVVAAVLIWESVVHRREQQRLRTLMSTREGESICQFARGVDTRNTDTWIIRAVYQELQDVLPVLDFPVRASDSLREHLGLDEDGIEYLIADVALQARRSLEEAQRNPYFGKVHSVADVVSFLNAQPPAR